MEKLKPGPLEGVTVLDFTWVLAGPFATRTLADMGAYIIKVERYNDGTNERHLPLIMETNEGVKQSSYNINCNRGKKSICIDLKNPEGKALIHELIKKSDVLIENCFAYCGDDNVAVKSTGWGGVLKDVNNIMVRGNVFLTRKSALKVGTETNANNMKNISFINNEVLMSDRCMAIYCRDGATISNVQFIGNHFEECHKDAKKRMMDMYIRKRKALGKIENVLIKDSSFDSHWPNHATIFSSIDGVTIENFIIAGKPCRDAREARISIGPNVNNATFNGEPVKY